MTATAKKIVNMLDMLPQQEQAFAYEMMKRIILARDPDFTKLTPKEAEELEQARIDFARGDFVRHEDINRD